MKKNANETAVKPAAKRGRPRKEAPVVEKKARKAKAEKPVQKDVKPAKALSANAKKLFLSARKPVSMLKKMSKEYSKILSEAMKLGDQKTVSHINKLFGYLGYTFADDAVRFNVSAKVKMPKVKMAKVPHAKKEEAEESIDAVIEKTIAETPVVVPEVVDDDPAPSKEIVVDAETAEKLANGEMSEDDLVTDDDEVLSDEDILDAEEEDEDDDLDVNDDDRETDIDDEQAEYRREFFGSVADNGDDY